MKKNNGFTLIELVAVITLLALIVLVSVPVMINTLSKTEQKEIEDFEKLVINAAELYLERNRDSYLYFNQIGDSLDITLETLINEGYLKSDIEVPYDNKEILKYKVVVMIEQNEILDYQLVEIKTFSELSTTSTEVTSINECVTNGIKCAPGTPFAIKVNENDVYNFYVISDDGNEVALLMDRNIYAEGNTTEPYLEWINASDYTETNADDKTSCSYDSCNDEGPITAVKELRKRTSGWSNISEREYTYSDDGGGNKYESFSKIMRARMLTYTEATSEGIGCTTNSASCPKWLYKNLLNMGDNNTYGYWTSAAVADSSSRAWRIHVDGYLNNGYGVFSAGGYGIRPVITLYKTL